MSEVRPIHAIADEIRHEWSNVHYAAVPYLDSMRYLNKVTDQFDQDPGKDVVLYFLSNARTWRGPAAKRIKAELKDMIK